MTIVKQKKKKAGKDRSLERLWLPELPLFHVLEVLCHTEQLAGVHRQPPDQRDGKLLFLLVGLPLLAVLWRADNLRRTYNSTGINNFETLKKILLSFCH